TLYARGRRRRYEAVGGGACIPFRTQGQEPPRRAAAGRRQQAHRGGSATSGLYVDIGTADDSVKSASAYQSDQGFVSPREQVQRRAAPRLSVGRDFLERDQAAS